MSKKKQNNQEISPAIKADDKQISKVDELNKRAWAQRNTSPKTSLELCQQAYRIAEQIPYPPGIAESLSTIAESLFWLSSYHNSLQKAEEALRFFTQLNDRRGQAKAMNTIGNIYHRLGDTDSSLENHTKSLELRKEIGDQIDIAHSLNNIGNIYLETGDYANALQYYTESLKIMQHIGEVRGEAGCLNNIGSVYQRLEEYESALDYYLKSLSMKNLIHDKAIETSCLNNIGSIYHITKDYEKALGYYFESLGITRELEDKWGEGLLLANIGHVYLGLGNHQEAIRYFNDSLSLATQISDNEGQTEALLGLAQLSCKERDGTKALAFLSKALVLAEKGPSPESLCRVHEVLSETYEIIGDSGLALKHYKEFNKLKEEFVSSEMQKKTRVLRIRFESEQALREKEIYRFKNEELAAAYERLQTLNLSLREADDQKTQLLDQLKVQTHTLEKQTREDSLTGLYNRRYLDFLLSHEFERARRYNTALSVAIADIDHFKRINDDFSHQVGDTVLKTISNIFTQNSRVIDTVARYGGEEFVFFFPQTPLTKAVIAADKIRKAVEIHDWSKIHPDLKVTISIGISADLHVSSHEKMISAADEKLYEAKRYGRNQVRY